MIRRALLALLLSGVAAPAQEVPFLADVAGVATDDVLNIRENPRSTAKLLGSLAPDAKRVEVVEISQSGTWGRVNLGETSGWTSLRYLAAHPVDASATLFDRGLLCVGAEPFWALSTLPEGRTARLRALGQEDRTFTERQTVVSANTGGSAQALVARDATTRLSATVRRAQCNDGISDQHFGLGVDVLLEDTGRPTLLSGCCTLQLR